MAGVDLSGAEVVDAHTHPYRLDELLERGSDGFDTRMTFQGEAFGSSSRLDQRLRPGADALTDSTVLALALRRWLAGYLGCEPTREALTAARDRALRADPVAYTKGLLDDEHVVAILTDDGFPQPPIPAREFEGYVGVPVSRVARLEPWILAHRDGSFDDLVQGVEQEAREAGADRNCVAFKSIVAYRTGLDVGNPDPKDAAQAFDRWRADDWRESREHAKPVRDFLLRHALAVAADLDRPFHIHCGAGDPDIDLGHAKPDDLWPLLVDHHRQPIVLIHAGFPWIPQAAYIASVLPHVHLEMSELVPWGWSMAEWGLEIMVGTAPAAKVLYGSDEAGEPEAFWLCARFARALLTRV
ncbi:MAG TPA: amidohydrolase family protein, partial [Actinomycetota bacterium]|nr:amidohydrolase family protein [Actinomycetota bacterium]